MHADAPTEQASAARRADHATIFLTSLAVIVFQIALTRVLSVVVWYHYAFLTLSLVMMGLGVPGVWLALSRQPDRYLPWCLGLSSVAIPLTTAAIVHFGWLALGGSVLVLILAVLPSTLLQGSVICLLLMRARGPAIARMYATDLAGACVGALAIIPLLRWLPTPTLMAGCAFAGALGLILYGARQRRVGLVLAVLLLGVLAWPALLRVTRSKDYDERGQGLVYEKWTPLARLTVFDQRFLAPVLEGGTRVPEARDWSYWLEQDGSAGTPLISFNGDLQAVSFLYRDVTTVGYQLRPPRRTAIIGAGGGRDILSALLAGSTEIDAIEINPDTIDLVSRRFGDVSGDIYHRPGVRAIEGDGRSVLTHSEGGYDLIQLSMIDSWAASASGAFALAENNLYTVEAFGLYLDKASERGLLSITRWVSELPRLIILARAALEARGIQAPERHLMLVQLDELATLLISRQPFTDSEYQQLRTLALGRGFPLLYPPGPGAERLPQAPLLAEIATGRYEGVRAAGLRTAPPTDDSPYFFHNVSTFSGRPTTLGAGLPYNTAAVTFLRASIVVVTLLALALFFLPLLVPRLTRAGREAPPTPLLRPMVFFAAIGAGFMLLENTLLQRFVLYLGHPSYAITVVLASLLCGMGVGSFLAPRIGVRMLARLGFLVPAVVGLLLLLLSPVFTATLGAPLGVRAVVSAGLLGGLGLALGVFFPLGMLRFGDAGKPWFWAINGAFGVMASVFSVALSMELGFRVVGGVAVAGYVLAWLCLRLPSRQ